MKKALTKTCIDGPVLLSYLFDELSPVEREGVDEHLAECDTCVDEFASLSQTRYPVLEWKQLEFDPLASPCLVVPTRKQSVFEAVYAFLTSAGGLKTGGAFAAIVVVAFLGIVYLRGGFTPGPVSVASVQVAEPQARTPDAVLPVSEPPVGNERALQNVEPRSEIASAKAVNTTPDQVGAHPRKNRRRATQPSGTELAIRVNSTDGKNADSLANAKMPVLSQFDEVKDNSLRLAEVFEDLDSRD